MLAHGAQHGSEEAAPLPRSSGCQQAEIKLLALVRSLSRGTLAVVGLPKGTTSRDRSEQTVIAQGIGIEGAAIFRR